MENTDHEKLLDEISDHLKPILDGSEQAIYVYLDDHHKTSNLKFAKLLGYDQVSEWTSLKGSFISNFVDNSSHDRLITAYQAAMDKYRGSSIEVFFKKKSKDKIKTKLILVPFLFKDHLFALHFISIA